jgi:hypothetical protein
MNKPPHADKNHPLHRYYRPEMDDYPDSEKSEEDR